MPTENPIPIVATQPEFAWLLDDGLLCVGATGCGFDMVTYTDERAIRFARKQDAESMRAALGVAGMHMMARRCKPAEHGWG